MNDLYGGPRMVDQHGSGALGSPNLAYGPYSATGGSQFMYGDITFSASKSDSVYGNASTVQPAVLCLMPLIKT